ncbi:MAG TPA: histidine kinase [Acidimicrobiales bacterium]|nr:histidine kinase [Acidimicrobiales bacterium]
MTVVADWRSGLNARALGLARLGGLIAILWVAAEQDKPGGAGEHLAVAVLMAVTAAGWLAWQSSRTLGEAGTVIWCGLFTVGVAGSALASLAPIALTFPAVAALGAAIAFEATPALVVALASVGAVLIAGGAAGDPAGFMVSGSLATVAGFTAGRTRRQYTERARQAEALLAERTRADAERDRATALAERNRIAREIHDVLAHSLGALAVQLDAADAVLEADGHSGKAHDLVKQARQLAVRGLAETRQAVHALRDEPVALEERLRALVVDDAASLCVAGTAHPVDTATGVALYRAAQEAVTNARKHAPGAPIELHLQYGPAATALTVTNGEPPGSAPGPLAPTGGGFGLVGMRERVELLGGTVSAGPAGAGFAVRVVIPT